MYQITDNMNFGQIFFNEMCGKYSYKYSFYKNNVHVTFRLTYIFINPNKKQPQ